MNTNTTLSKGSRIHLNQRQAARTGILLPLLLLLSLACVVQAQFTYTTNNGTITITGYTGPGGDVSIPSTINGLPVTTIGGNDNVPFGAFQDCASLTSVTIPDSVTSIGDAAFCGCWRLTSVTIPNSVTNIGMTAFCRCGLTSVTIPGSVTYTGPDTFALCTNLTDVTIGNGVTSTGGEEFWYCNRLTNVTIPSSLTIILGYAFTGCGLTSVTIPESVTIIAIGAFQSCASLTNVTIPDSVTNIGAFAFASCTSLTSVTIGNGVTSIEQDAFDGCTSLTSVTIPKSVTSIGPGAFQSCTSLPSITVDTLNPVYSTVAGVLFNKSQTTLIEYPAGKAGTSYTIPNNVTNIGVVAFSSCSGLTTVTIPNSVTTIELDAFSACSNLASVTIGNRLTSIGNWAFYNCISLTGVYFLGNAPSLGSFVFSGDNHATVYYLSGATGWGTTFGGRPTAMWTPVNPPTLLTSPRTQTAEAGAVVGLRVEASGSLPLFCLWYLNSTNLISCGTSCELELTNLQLSQSGAYTVVVTNAAGAVTSAPVMLNVIAAVERRPVPGVKVTGQTGSLWNVDYADSLSPAPNWTPLGSVSLTTTPQYCFDLTLPLPPQRFYRARQAGTPGVRPSLDLHLVPAITVTGTLGHSVRLDYINQFGPTDAWVTLATVPLTNTSQLYFDVSAHGQPPRLYRLVPSP